MKVTRRIIYCMGAILWFTLHAEAQVSNSLFFMKGVPQSNRVNPAYQPDCGFYIGIPSLAPLRVEGSSSSFAYQDIIYPDPAGDSLITFLHPQGDLEAFMGKLKPVNYILSDVGMALISFGFRTDIGFFSADVTTRFDGNVFFPDDFASLLLTGTEEGRSYNLDGLATDLMAFDEVSVGWSGAILDNLNVGVRGKVFFGIGNLSTINSDLSVVTSEDKWLLQSDMLFDASLPFADVTYDEEGMIEDIVLKEDVQNLDHWALTKYAFNAKNFGLGIDLGMDYRPVEKLLLSASLLDIGYIKWKDEVHKVSYSTEYEFSGFEVKPFEFTDEYTFENYLDSAFSQLGDTLYGFLKAKPGGSYSRSLNTKLYVGASYDITSRINIGLLSRTDFLKSQATEQVTASANFSINRFLNFALSYSYINSYFKNVGGGVSLNAGPVNLYVISDNALNLLFWPQETRAVNVWFGFNLVFGFKDLYRDRPLVY